MCCVAPGFSASADFAIDKPAGKACPNLAPDFRCGVHQHLRQQGFRGCAVYDCFGAGQWVSQFTFGGVDWRRAPDTARTMFRVFAIIRQLHELLWYLSQALAARPARPLHSDLRRAFEETERVTRSPAAVLLELDLRAHRGTVNDLLQRASELMRSSVPGQKRDHAGADFIGARLSGTDLAGASLRGTCLIGADLTGADLRAADLTGADLRDADLSGADLTDSLFLTQSQLDAAEGDARTRVPRLLARPAHWPPPAA